MMSAMDSWFVVGLDNGGTKNNATVLDETAVCDADDATRGGDAIGIVQHRLRNAKESVLLEHGVRVDRANEGKPSRVDPAVHGVGLAAVLLFDHGELGMPT